MHAVPNIDAKSRAEAVAEGTAILRANAQHTDAHVRAARLRDFDGALVPCVNATMLQSEIGAALNERFPETPFSATYFDREDGQRVWSLRTRRDDVDVPEIAKRHGGGGHRAAAGFTEQVDAEALRAALRAAEERAERLEKRLTEIQGLLRYATPGTCIPCLEAQQCERIPDCLTRERNHERALALAGGD